MNVAIITGRLTQDVKLNMSASNVAVTSFTIATPKNYSKDSGNTANFIDCVAFGKTAEFISNYFKKGSKIEVLGEINTRIYEYDGAKRKAVELVVEKVKFGESKSTTADAKPDEADINSFMPIDDADLPF